MDDSKSSPAESNDVAPDPLAFTVEGASGELDALSARLAKEGRANDAAIAALGRQTIRVLYHELCEARAVLAKGGK